MKQTRRFSIFSWLNTNKREIFQRAFSFFLCGLTCALLGPVPIGRPVLIALGIFLLAAPVVGIITVIIGRYIRDGFISASLEYTSKSTRHL